MAATYSPDLRIELIGNGEQAGTWGVTTNTNLGTLIEQAIAGVVTVSLTNLTSYTLLALNGASDQARQAAIVFNGTLSANCNVVAPSVNKLYVLNNQTTGGFNVNIKTSSGNTYAITPNTTAFVYCDTLNFYDGLNAINSNLTLNAKAIIYGDVLGNVNTGQWFVPSGNTAQRTSSPVNGLIRYNSDGIGFYEGYANSTWIRFITAPEGNYTLTYLIVSGGAGGATNGGGGAGGYIANTLTATPTTVYNIVVGGGGAASTNGNPSYITGVATGVGGGTGGIINTPRGTAGSAGGSGGGGGGGFNAGDPGGAGGSASQGSAGGAGGSQNTGYGTGGGGGGAGATGGNGVFDGAAGAGGVGTVNTITGVSVTYAGGGGGGASNFYSSTGGGGGAGGGGAGGNASAPGGNGTAYTGGGGGGGASGQSGGSGGAGVVIISVPTVNYSGTYTGLPTITTSAGNTILKYTSSGTYTA